jgi:hypothetical protein
MADIYAFAGDELGPSDDRRREGVWEKKIMPASTTGAPATVCVPDYVISRPCREEVVLQETIRGLLTSTGRRLMQPQRAEIRPSARRKVRVVCINGF